MNDYCITISRLKEGQELPQMFIEFSEIEMNEVTKALLHIIRQRKIVEADTERRASMSVALGASYSSSNSVDVMCDAYKGFASEIIGVNYGEIERRIMATSPEAFKDTSEGKRRFHKLFEVLEENERTRELLKNPPKPFTKGDDNA